MSQFWAGAASEKVVGALRKKIENPRELAQESQEGVRWAANRDAQRGKKLWKAPKRETNLPVYNPPPVTKAPSKSQPVVIPGPKRTVDKEV